MNLRSFTLFLFFACIGLSCKAFASETYEEKVKNIVEFMKLPEVVYLSSNGPDGWPWVRAMVNLKSSLFSDDVIYRTGSMETFFITSAKSNKVAQFMKNSKAGVYFYTPRLNTKALYLMGDIEIISDNKEKLKYIDKEKSKFYSRDDNISDFVVLKFIPKKVISYYRGITDAFDVK